MKIKVTQKAITKAQNDVNEEIAKLAKNVSYHYSNAKEKAEALTILSRVALNLSRAENYRKAEPRYAKWCVAFAIRAGGLYDEAIAALPPSQAATFMHIDYSVADMLKHHFVD